MIEAKSKIFDKPGSEDFNINKADISFNKVNFEYEINENKVLQDVNIEIEGGKMTALVTTGVGKSTILNLIPRLHDISGGDIKVDGRSIYDKIKIIKIKYIFSFTRCYFV